MFDEIGVLLRGMMLGFMIAAPLGPVGLMCIRRTVRSGILIGFMTGMGAAIVDGIFGAVAVFGVAAIIEPIREYSRPLYIIGGVFLLAVAWWTWRERPHQPKPDIDSVADVTATSNHNRLQQVYNTIQQIIHAIGSSFIVTATNPITLFGTLAIVATLGGLRSTTEASVLVLGIFSGSAAWWLVLSSGIALVCRNLVITEARIMLINRITAVALAVLAVWIIIAGVMNYQINSAISAEKATDTCATQFLDKKGC